MNSIDRITCRCSPSKSMLGRPPRNRRSAVFSRPLVSSCNNWIRAHPTWISIRLYVTERSRAPSRYLSLHGRTAARPSIVGRELRERGTNRRPLFQHFFSISTFPIGSTVTPTPEWHARDTVSPWRLYSRRWFHSRLLRRTILLTDRQGTVNLPERSTLVAQFAGDLRQLYAIKESWKSSRLSFSVLEEICFSSVAMANYFLRINSEYYNTHQGSTNWVFGHFICYITEDHVISKIISISNYIWTLMHGVTIFYHLFSFCRWLTNIYNNLQNNPVTENSSFQISLDHL